MDNPLNKREYLAGLALQALLSNSSLYGQNESYTIDDAAQDAVQVSARLLTYLDREAQEQQRGSS